MSDLEREIFDIIKYASNEDGYVEDTIAAKEVERIKRAFKDAGWEDNSAFRAFNEALNAAPVPIENRTGRVWIPEGYMTGQEWFYRFKMELIAIPTLWTKDVIPRQLSLYGQKCLEAAKKAAGLE